MAYTVDGEGNLIDLSNGYPYPGSYSYPLSTYDDQGRLIFEQIDPHSSSEYRYDDTGNLIYERQQVNASQFIITYTYDNDGNLTTKTTDRGYERVIETYNGNYTLSIGSGYDTIIGFGGFGTGANPSAAVLANLDTLQFNGTGLIAKNLQLTQNGTNLEITFEGVANTLVTLQNFDLQNLENQAAYGSTAARGNILFDGQTTITNGFDVINANSTQTTLFARNVVTFLNDLDNDIIGFDNSADVINGQGGNDTIHGRSGNDLLRGGTGNDVLIGGAGNDTLTGNAGNDVLIGGKGADSFFYNTFTPFTTTAIGEDIITDFNHSEGDKIVLSKSTFGMITSDVGTGLSNATDFSIVTTNVEGTSSAAIVYNSVTGKLFYNSNGTASGFGDGGLLTQLTSNYILTATDFVIQGY
ncbi:calcium-binding protein [Nostoc sp. MG11]|uniref:calcium-binding protein n=1 Tax=Nostoc sp. MG11 TaxID=2721166 RepID=UPI0018696182|nr:calcium-binding protein [Nostoc sp. MG11]